MGFLHLPLDYISLTTSNRTAWTNPPDGQQVYDTTEKKYYFWKASTSEWTELGAGSGDGITDLTFNPTSSSIIMPPLFDDFLYQRANEGGPFGFQHVSNGTGAISGLSSTSNPNTSELNRVGIARFQPGSSATNYSGVVANSNATLLGGTAFEYAMAIHIANLPDATNDYTLRVGFANTWPGVQHGFDLIMDRSLSTTKWYLRAIANSVVTQTATSADLATGWHNLRLVVNAAATTLTAYINGVQVGQLSSGLPVSSAQTCGPILITQLVAGTQRVVLCDWAYLEYQINSNRGTF